MALVEVKINLMAPDEKPEEAEYQTDGLRLHYAQAKQKDRLLRDSLLLGGGAYFTAALVSLCANFAGQFMRYLGPWYDLLFVLAFSAVAVAFGCSIFYAASRLLGARKRASPWRPRVTLGIGCAWGFAVAAPQVIDIAVSGRGLDRWGAPIGSGVGDAIGLVMLIAGPVALAFAATRHSEVP